MAGAAGGHKGDCLNGSTPQNLRRGRTGAHAASQRRICRCNRALLALALVAAGGLKPDPALARGPDSLADLADTVSDAVVNISATQMIEEKHAGNTPDLEPGTPFDDLFEEFFRRRQGENPNQKRHERKSNSLGSGFVVDPSGVVITNNH